MLRKRVDYLEGALAALGENFLLLTERVEELEEEGDVELRQAFEAYKDELEKVINRDGYISTMTQSQYMIPSLRGLPDLNDDDYLSGYPGLAPSSNIFMAKIDHNELFNTGE